MTTAEAAAFLRKYNVWRRGNLDDQPMPDPREIGEAIDAAVAMIDRLEAAEGELETERMRLAACGIAALGYFEGCTKKYTSASLDDVLNLRKRLEAAEKELVEIRHGAAVANNTIKALRAKIAEMEKQEPVAHVWRCDNGHIHGSCESELLMGQQLYALPGAKGEKDV